VIIFWIFTLFVGASTFAFTYIFLQLGLAWSGVASSHSCSVRRISTTGAWRT
jgi:hypothetical protein